MYNKLLLLLLRDHRQLYPKSCSPSLVEIMLKYHRLVPQDFYELQEKYQNENVGLIYFAGQTLHGLRIERHDPSKGQSFVGFIRNEFPKGRLIGLYCVTPGQNSCHGWIVAEVLGDRIFLLSKCSELGNGEGKETVRLEMSLEGKGAIQITDVIVGTPVAEKQMEQ